MEHTSVTLDCELSKPNQKVTWLKNGEEIIASDDVELVVDDTVHKLVLKSASIDDDAEYTIRLENNEESSAHLYVEGLQPWSKVVISSK